MKKNIKHFLFLAASAGTVIHLMNRTVNRTACMKEILSSHPGHYYDWKHGRIYYTKTGSGAPLLLIHDLHPASSSYEWSRMMKKLEKTNTVYTIDLLGCGRSDKPNITYTNYLYVQLINEFISNVINEKTDVIATGDSLSFVVMACQMEAKYYDHIVGVCPTDLYELAKAPGRRKNMLKFLIELPIIGTLLYNIASSKKMIMEELVTKKLYNPYSAKSSYVDACYEAAHRGASPKSTFASIRCNYTKCNLVNALKKIDNSIYLVGGANIDNIEERLNEYKNYNSSIETILVPQTKELAHFEHPEKIAELVKTYFC